MNTLKVETLATRRPHWLLERQRDSDGTYHQDRTNLLVHIVAVPGFMLGNVLVVFGGAMVSPTLFAVGLVLTVGSIAAQERGHWSEPVPGRPFAGPADFVKRLFLEQWITFPRFARSERWRAKLAEPGNVAA